MILEAHVEFATWSALFGPLWKSLCLRSYFSAKQFAQIFTDGTEEEKISKQIFSQSDLNRDLNQMT